MKMVNAILNRPGAAPSDPPRSRSGPPLLDAVNRAGKSRGARASPGEVVYWVTPRPALTASGEREKRADAREGLRLRSAKVLDGTYRFLCEGRLCDRSLNGLRILLGRNVRVPRCLAVHVDETSEVRRGRVMWRKGLTIGVRLDGLAPPGALRPSDRLALRERYYGIPD